MSSNLINNAPKDLVRILKAIYKDPMSVIIIRGLPKSGKTDFMLLLFEVLKDLGLIKHFASNTHTKTDWVNTIEALNVLRAWASSDRSPKIFGYDEVIESATNRRAMSDLNVAWVKFLPQISKYHLHILALVQEDQRGRKYYESVFTDPVFLRGLWTKVSKTYARFESSFLEIEGYDLTTVPRTHIKFDKDLIATFSLSASPSLADFNKLNRTIQVAMVYQNETGTFEDIKKMTGLSDRKQIQRELKKICRLFVQGNKTEIDKALITDPQETILDKIKLK